MDLPEARACGGPEAITLGGIVLPLLDHGGDAADDLEVWPVAVHALQQDGVLDQWRALSVLTACEATAVPSDLKSRHDRLSSRWYPNRRGKL